MMNEQRISLDQDLLVAYVDGELPAAEAGAVEAALAHDEAARETVRLLRLSADVAARAFADMADQPVPERLVTAARAGARHAGSQSRGVRHGAARWLLPIAASFAMLAIGLAGGYALRGAPDQAQVATSTAGGSGTGDGYRLATGEVDKLAASFEATLQGVLDSGAAGQSFAYRAPGVGDGRIELGRSFTTGFGTDCREFHRDETRGAARRASNGLACRSADGSWNAMLFPGS
jgi:Putative zinc-finger